MGKRLRTYPVCVHDVNRFRHFLLDNTINAKSHEYDLHHITQHEQASHSDVEGVLVLCEEEHALMSICTIPILVMEILFIQDWTMSINDAPDHVRMTHMPCTLHAASPA